MKTFIINGYKVQANDAVQAVKFYKLIDANNVAEIDYLTEEEKQAVEDYREAIKKTTNPKLLEVYAHILKEETEHIKELQEAKNLDDAKYDDKTKLINDLKVVLASIKANKTSEAIGLLEDVLYHL